MIRNWSNGRGLAVAAGLAAALLAETAMAAPPDAPCPSTGDAVRLEVTVEGVRSAKGTISIAVYGDRPEDFLAKGKKLRKLRLTAQAGTVQGCLSLPRPGTYAFTAYHDEDGDRHFTRNLVGLPSEGFAVSNAEAGLLALPSFAEAATTVNAPVSKVTLRMHYP